MLKIPRICVPLSMDCDFNCRYCYRHAGKRDIPDFNDLMREYLRNTSPDWCRAVVASGGEPLLHMDKVYELFSYVPDNVHKKVMTNGFNLTQEFVDWANSKNVEIHISHDGRWTEYLRGYDILKDPELLDLVQQIKVLKIFSVCTNKNPNPYQNYLDVKDALKRDDFRFASQAIFEDKLFPDLVEGFDYDEYSRGYIEMVYADILHWRWEPKGLMRRSEGFNVLPDGTVVGMSKITHTYGTILDDIETLVKRKEELGDMDVCRNMKCRVRNECFCMSQLASPHSCKAIRIQADAFAFVRNEGNEENYE